MKILFFTDLHAAEKPPAQRGADYADLLFEKLAEMREAAASCDCTLMGGDWLHHRNPNATSHRLIQRLINFLRTWPTEIITLAGNHDQGPEGLASLPRMPLGVLLEALPDKLIFREEPILFDDVEIVPFHWTPERDRYPSPSQYWHHRSAEIVIAMTHSMIMPPGGGWPFPALGFDDIESPDIDLVLCGHTHWRTEGVSGSTLFHGPGAVARTARTEQELLRQPAYAIIETNPLGVWTIPLECARPGAEVFAWKEAKDKRISGEMFRGYVETLETALAVGAQPLDTILEGLERRVPPAVATLVRSYLERAETG